MEFVVTILRHGSSALLLGEDSPTQYNIHLRAERERKAVLRYRISLAVDLSTRETQTKLPRNGHGGRKTRTRHQNDLSAVGCLVRNNYCRQINVNGVVGDSGPFCPSPGTLDCFELQGR